MKAMSVIPGRGGSALIAESPDPSPAEGSVLAVGTVSAARRHYEQAVEALAGADPAWLGGLISRRVALSVWPQALARQPSAVKVVVDLTK